MAGADDIVIKLFAAELYLFFDWLLANTCEIIDSSYQLSDHVAYQPNPVIGLI